MSYPAPLTRDLWCIARTLGTSGREPAGSYLLTRTVQSRCTSRRSRCSNARPAWTTRHQGANTRTVAPPRGKVNRFSACRGCRASGEGALAAKPLERAVEGVHQPIEVGIGHRGVEPAVAATPAVVHAVQQHRQVERGAERAHAAVEARRVHLPVVETE